MSTRNQVICAVAGPIALLTFFVGFALAGFLPPPSPSLSLAQVTHLYSSSPTMVRLGCAVMVFSCGIVTPFAAVLAVHMRRVEGREAPVLSMTQFAAGTAGILLFLMEAIFWSVAAYRPHRNPQITQVLNDIAWFFTVMPGALIVVQALTVAVVILSHRDQIVFPRWLGYFNLWAAVLYLPGGLEIFFKHGPLAWNGLLAFWVPACAYFAWFTVMALQLTRAVRTQRLPPGQSAQPSFTVGSSGAY
jgi:hypothetical protein